MIGVEGIRRFDTKTGDRQPDAALDNQQSRLFRAGFTSDGHLWIGRKQDTLLVDLTAGTTQVLPFPGAILAILDGKAYVGSENNNTIIQLDNSGVEAAEYSFAGGATGHWIGRSPF